MGRYDRGQIAQRVFVTEIIDGMVSLIGTPFLAAHGFAVATAMLAETWGNRRKHYTSADGLRSGGAGPGY